MEELKIVLTLWLSTTFSLPHSSSPPNVVLAPPDRVAFVRFGRRDGMDGRDTVGVYHPPTQTIYLRHDWNPHDIADVSVLVHELVHHLQHLGSLPYACPELREAPAYEAQAHWLEMCGKSLEDTYELNPMTLKLRTQCMR